MPIYKLAQGHIRWPAKCAACGLPATATVKSSCSIVTGVGYYVLFMRTTHLRTSISYPVCGRHLWLARIAGIISARNLLNLALCVLWAFPAMAVIFVVFDKLFNGVSIEAPDVVLTNSVIVAIGIAVFMFGRRFTPIKLTAATEEAVTIFIRDDTYAHEFENLNARVVLPTHSRQQS